MKRTMRWLFATVLLVVVAAGALAMLVTPAEAGRCICPKIYAPVLCDNGRVYPNQCVADCQHAKNCVPLPL
jgi:hypothetical protein